MLIIVRSRAPRNHGSLLSLFKQSWSVARGRLLAEATRALGAVPLSGLRDWEKRQAHRIQRAWLGRAKVLHGSSDDSAHKSQANASADSQDTSLSFPFPRVPQSLLVCVHCHHIHTCGDLTVKLQLNCKCSDCYQHVFRRKYLRNRVFRAKTTSKQKSFINMPLCTNYIIGNWCKQRATLWATMHGRPYTPGTSYDQSHNSVAEAMMSSGSRQERLRLGGPVTTFASALGLTW